MLNLYKEYHGMPIMPYDDREALKRASTSQEEIDWAHYNRFLEGCVDESQPQLYSEDVHPTFAEYRSWKVKYKGWSIGHITPGRHDFWKVGSKKRDYPMNLYPKK